MCFWFLGLEGRRFAWAPWRRIYHTESVRRSAEVFWDMQHIEDEARQPRTWSFEDQRLINQWGPVGDVPGLLAITIPNVDAGRGAVTLSF